MYMRPPTCMQHRYPLGYTSILCASTHLQCLKLGNFCKVIKYRGISSTNLDSNLLLPPTWEICSWRGSSAQDLPPRPLGGHAASGVIALRPHRFRTADSDPRLRATTCLQVARRAQRIPPRGRRRRRVTCMRRAAPGELCSRPMVPGERPARAGSKSAPQFSTGAFILACRASGYRSAALAVPLCLHISPRDARAHFPVLTPSLLYFGRRASPSAGRNVTPLL